MEKIGEKIRGKRNLLECLVEWIGGKKTNGIREFSPQAHQNIFFLQIGEKIKGEKANKQKDQKTMT